jgi:hypothetical protein
MAQRATVSAAVDPVTDRSNRDLVREKNLPNESLGTNAKATGATRAKTWLTVAVDPQVSDVAYSSRVRHGAQP